MKYVENHVRVCLFMCCLQVIYIQVLGIAVCKVLGKKKRSKYVQPIRRVIENRNVPLPSNLPSFLSLPGNIEDLAFFLASVLNAALSLKYIRPLVSTFFNKISNSNDLFLDLRDPLVSAIAIGTGISSCLNARKIGQKQLEDFVKDRLVLKDEELSPKIPLSN
jgi:hypothetical protein